jgi:hypothetical protein
MPDAGPRHNARAALREYDNPKGGRNKNYQSKEYLRSVLQQYKMTEAELREYANAIQYGGAYK